MRGIRGTKAKPADGDEDLTREEWELVQFLEDSGGDVARVYIYRVQKNGEVEWIDTTVPTGMNEESLRDAYGPGKYELKFKGTNQKFLASKRILIGETRPGSTLPAVNQNAGLSSGDFQLRFLETQMKAQSEMYQAIIGAIGNRKESDPAAMLSSVVSMFTVLKGAAGPADGGGDQLEKLKTVIEIVQGLTGDGPVKEVAEDNLYSLLKTVGGQVVEIARPAIEAAARGVAGVTIPATARSIPETTAAAGVAPGAGGVETAADPAGGLMLNGKSQLEWLKIGLGYLKDKAKRNIEVGLCVDWIFANDHEPQNGVLLGAVQQGYTFPQLLTFDPEIDKDSAMRQWFSNLYDELHKAITESSATADTHGAVDTGRTNGDAGNAASHEADGAGGPDKASGVGSIEPV